MKTAVFFTALAFAACDGGPGNVLHEASVPAAQASLATFAANTGKATLVVFESGLGDDHSVWAAMAEDLADRFDVVTYDRAGYGKSTNASGSRGISALATDLGAVVDHYADGRAVVLVGHSLGGMIMRDYAVRNPSSIAALVFVDASHELYNQPSQADEDAIVDLFATTDGDEAGSTREARELIEDSAYMARLPGLPDRPVVVVDSMRVDAQHDAADRQRWYDAKETLGVGVSDFTHLTTSTAGHYIMREAPQLVRDAIVDATL